MNPKVKRKIMATLYRKYRPQNFNEVVGQNHIKLTLEHEIESGKIAHAYLFCGPRAVGKTTMARVFAKAINCQNRKEGEFEPCNKCESCKDITEGRSMDIIEIDAASHTGVDNVRENIIASARVAPTREKFKVFIIDEVHMLSISAFNALLKIIEEPPKNVVFILCTTEIHKVPTTIISRCQRFDFKRISLLDVFKKLNYIAENEGVKVEKEILEAIARQSEGHMRDAESLFGQIISISGKKVSKEEALLVIPRNDLREVIGLIEFLSKKDAGGGIGLINKLVDEGIDLKIFVADLIDVLRKMLIAKVNPGLAEKLGIEFGESFEKKMSEIGRSLSVPELVIIAEKFLNVRENLKNASIIQLPIELALIEFCESKQPVRAESNRPSEKKPEAEAEENSRAEIISGVLNIDHEQILEKWNEVLAKVKKYNHSLTFILRVCEPRDLKDNRLRLAFKYKFHKDRISEANIKILVEKVLREVYGASLAVEAIIDENLEIKTSEPDQAPAPEEKKEEEPEQGRNAIDNLLKTFGGRVVG